MNPDRTRPPRIGEGSAHNNERALRARYWIPVVPAGFARATGMTMLLCLLAGSLCALSMAPANFWPALLIGLPVFYINLHHTKTHKMAFAQGWAFGFGYFVFSLYWIGNALLVDGNPYAWAWILAVCGLPATLAFFTGFAALTISRLCALSTLSGWLGFTAFFTLFEWLRGHILTGFPWNLFGYTWADHPALLQMLSFSDIYGLTFFTVLWASLPALLILNTSHKTRVIAALIAALSFSGILGFGFWRLHASPLTFHENINIRIVQPNIDQAEKWDIHQMSAHFDKHLMLSENQGKTDDKTTYIIWPETALTYRLANDPGAMDALKLTLKTYPHPATLFTGMLRYNPADQSYTNSLVMINDAGEIKNAYDKYHLVPFGEYIPFQDWIPLDPITQFKGFKTGAGLQTFSTPDGLRYSPLVCYEIIFSGKTVRDESTDFILNVTNDAWYGISPGPYQHFTQARFRAMETGVPVIRAANTGFSGIAAPDGSIMGAAPLFTESAQDLPLPQKNTLTITPPHIKTAIFFALLLLSGGVALVQRKRFTKPL